MRKGVATRRKEKAISIPPFAHDAMSPESPLAQAKHDLAAARIRNAMTSHSKQVARINRGDHAAAARNKANLTKAAQDLSSKIHTNLRQRHRSIHQNLPRSHEFLRLKRHWRCVGANLPHASAIVSKTFSCWNPGFLYSRFDFSVTSADCRSLVGRVFRGSVIGAPSASA